MADMTPAEVHEEGIMAGMGDTPQHQDSAGLDSVAFGCRSGQDLPEDVIFNLGPFRFVAELWRVLKPGGRAS